MPHQDPPRPDPSGRPARFRSLDDVRDAARHGDPLAPETGSSETDFYYGLEASTVAAGESGAATRLTDLLHAWRQGDERAVEQLTERLHDELLRVARRAMRQDREARALEPATLVQEAFLRLMGNGVPWRDRAHFFAMSASLMRRILVDHAHTTQRHKPGDGTAHLTLREAGTRGPVVDLLRLDSALRELEQRDRDQGRMIELHYFSGLLDDEIAEIVGIQRATVGRELRFGRAWLRRRLRDGSD